MMCLSVLKLPRGFDAIEAGRELPRQAGGDPDAGNMYVSYKSKHRLMDRAISDRMMVNIGEDIVVVQNWCS